MKLALGVIIGALIVLGLILAFRGKISSTSSTISNTSGTSYELDKRTADLGQMAVSDEKSAVFTLKNTDSQSITLSDFNTSCNCTDAVVKIGDKTSPRFNMKMHMSATDAAWNSTLPPGATAEIEIIYMPAKMPVYGPVSRYLDFVVGGKREKLTITATVK